MSEAYHGEIKFTDADVVNLGNWIPAGEYNPHKVRPWLLHDHGFILCVVFASHLGDALDEAADADKLDQYQLDPNNSEHRADYGNGKPTEEWDWDDRVAFLGNGSDVFDIESLGVIELPNPPASFAAQFAAAFPGRP